eukprot:TRINITY_DN2090_c0_g1_i1.p1 TRINITY_DN2090_c0_g1~~TRINITY_DN2090_c0_g1_i1.p1  ORF type:complete len:609 (+),score=112.73 TRINITY_DN2090_c0_g1_i1:252-1829(+)
MELMDWAMTMADKFDAKQGDPKYDAAAAMKDCALQYAKGHKVDLSAIEVEDASSAASPTGEQEFDDQSYIPPADLQRDLSRVPLERMTPTERLIHSLEGEYQKLGVAALRDEQGIYVIIDKSQPLSWMITLFNFPQDSHIGQDLQEYRSRYGISDVLVEARFTTDFPLVPPTVRVVRPRMLPNTGNVRHGGTMHVDMLSRSHWIPGFKLRDVVLSIKESLVVHDARIQMRGRINYPRYGDLYVDKPPTFRLNQAVATLTCYEPSFLGMSELEAGNVISMPFSLRKEMERKSVQWPFYFRIAAQNSPVSTVVAVPNFDLPDDIMLCPVWLMQNLGIDNGGKVTVASMNVKLGEFVQFQPQTVDFGEDLGGADDALALIAQALHPFWTLSEGDVLPIQVRNKTYWLAVTKVSPDKHICIHPPSHDEELSLKMDLLPAVEANTGVQGAGAAAVPRAPQSPSQPYTHTMRSPATGQRKVHRPTNQPVKPPPPQRAPADNDFPASIMCVCGQEVSVYELDAHDPHCRAKN